MRIPLVYIFLGLGVVLGAGDESLLVSESGKTGATVAERRAVVMGAELKRFETMKGRVYEAVKITEINDGGISFTHASGAARLRFDDLSPDQRRNFGISEEVAAEIYRKEQKARLAYEKKVEEREAARKLAAEKQAEALRLVTEKAAEKAAKELTEREQALVSWSVPSFPEIKSESISTSRFSKRSHRSHRSHRVHSYSYGYPGYYHSGYYPRYQYAGGSYFGRSGGYCSPRTPGIVIRW